jgi:phosphatidylserine decarboxylase
MAIARQAWLLVAVAGIISGLVYILCGFYCSLPLIIIAMALLYVFRDPERRVPPIPLGVVSPVDGRVVAVGEVNDPFLGRKAVKLTIRMRPLGPWIVRGAMEGRVMQLWHLPKGLDTQSVAGMDKDRFVGGPHARQRHFAMWIQSDELDDVVIALRGGFILRRLRCAVQAGDRIGQGRRCGLLLFPATADVYVPAVSRIEVEPGGTVGAGSDIIAILVHKEKPAVASLAG